MKRILLPFIIAFCFANTGSAQTLTQSNFTCTILPKVMGSGTGTRLPLVFRATLSGLAPNTLYRYYTNLALITDFGTTNSGAGNPLFTNSTTFRYTTGAGLNTAGAAGYDSITTDASGNYSGWFTVVNTGNARFTAGNYVHPSIVLDSAGVKRGVTNSLFVALDSVLVLGYSASSGVNNGSAIRGTSFATDKNIVLLYDNTAGTGRPVSACIVENLGLTVASVTPFYSTSVSGVSGAWGTIIPNTLANGIMRIEQRAFSNGAIVNANTSANGTWGTTNTVNPTANTTALVIASANAPLPVTFNSFAVTKSVYAIILKWSTASETNNSHFEVQRSVDGKNFEVITKVKGAGNSSKVVSYSFNDVKVPAASIVYYRLKQVDFDGISEFSKTVSIMNAAQKSSLGASLPNPFNTELNVTINAVAASAATVEIIDMIGKTHRTSSEQLVEGANKVTIETNDMPNGIYFIRVTANGETFTQKVIKK